MDRRTFGKLSGLAAMNTMIANAETTDAPENWKSGKDSPLHDSDRLIPVSGKAVTLENNLVRVSFDARSGAMIELVAKKTNWNVQRNAKLGESFRVFAPTPDRSYNPVLGARNRAKSIAKSEDGKSLVIVWSNLLSEYSGTLDITLTGTVTLEGDSVSFDMTMHNGSPNVVSSVEWPVIGALTVPPGSPTLSRVGFTLGGYTDQAPLYPKFGQELNGCGVSWPTQASEGRYALVVGDHEGLYVGCHDRTAKDMTRYTYELKPGWLDSRFIGVPEIEEVSGHPIRTTMSVQQFPFSPPGETYELGRVVIAPYQGTWHKGVDVYRRWFNSWFRAPTTPAWFKQPHSWHQIALNSPEDDLRTTYRDLPRRAREAARAGVTALLITGWNHLGQDRNNPSHDTDPRLGTLDDFKSAIAAIERSGMRVIIFNKYTWADTSTDWYRNELHRYMAHDPNGVVYYHHGFRYQTPEQLADINTRRFSAACQNSDQWVALCKREFQKSLDLPASGILYDEVMHHGGANFCFSKDHGHRSPASLWSGDLRLGKVFRDMVREQKGEDKFVMAGEGLSDLLTQYYSLSYIRIRDVHVPVSRYNDPHSTIMIAITGFDDREMINAALQFRYVMQFEPFIFKGNVDDFPLSRDYGRKVEDFRRKYRSFVWDGEFRDCQDATLTVNQKPSSLFSVFIGTDGKRAAVIPNNTRQPLAAYIAFDGSRRALAMASPEQPEARPCDGSVAVPPRSVVLVMES